MVEELPIVLYVKNKKGETMLKEWLNKLRKKQPENKSKPTAKKTTTVKTKKSKLSIFQKKSKEYPNRFLKFYHENKSRLNNERRSSYSERKSQGICVRCNKKALPKIVFCSYHQQKQKGYNKQARSP